MALRDRLRSAAGAALALAGDTLTFTGEALAKARLEEDDPEGQEHAPGGKRVDDAANAPLPSEPTTEDPKTMFWDPFAIVEQLGYKDKPTSISYGTLRAIPRRMPILKIIMQTRINQVAAFARVQHNRYQIGYRVKLRDSEQEPTKADKKWMQQAETMLARTGVTDNPRGRANFETFLRQLTLDSLMFDQACFEIVPDRQGLPCEWYAVDASTIRLADTGANAPTKKPTSDTHYVQIYDGLIITEYTDQEMAFGIRNPTTNIRLHGYGESELEMLIHAITSLLYSWDYNTRFFSQGSGQKGLLNFKGTVPERQMKAFRRHWYQMLSGVENAWRTPITNADEVQWINMQSSNKDMEFNAWFDFLIKIACGMYSMDPAEINFKYGNTGQRGGLSEAPNRDKVVESKERGLRPLLGFFAGQINRNIIWPINESFEFEFVGLDSATREDQAKLNQTRCKTTMTVDEMRAEDDLPPLPDGAGKVILDPSWLQFYQIKKGEAEAGAEGEGDGDQRAEAPGEAEDPEDFEAMLRQFEESDTGDAEEDEAEEAQKSLKPWVDITL